MLPTVSDVLAMPELREGDPVVLAGRDLLSRPVRWAHAAELAEIAHLLRGGELVLTTGIALPDDPARLDLYARELRQADVAGLVVELGRHWTARPPDALVSACERERLPLVALRREIRFAALTQAIGERIVDAQVVELRAAEQIHDTFTALSVADAGPAEILAEVARIAGNPVVLESFRNAVLAYHTAGRPAPEVLHDWAARSRMVRMDARTRYNQANGWLVTLVGSRGDDWGRLVLINPQPPPHRDIVVIERAAATLALHRLHARHRDSIERQAHHALLSSLRDRVIDDDLLARCAQAGVQLSDHRLLGLAARPVVRVELPTFAGTDAVTALAESLASALRNRGVPALVASEDSDVLALLALPGHVDVDDLLTRVAADIRAPEDARVGIGELAHRPADAGRSVAEAHHVVASLRVDDTQLVHRLADVHLRGLLRLLGDDDRLARFVQRELGPLRDYDREHRTHLTDALRAVVTTSGKTAAAAALHVSRPALYDRITRIERILGVNLTDPETRTSLHTALLAADLAAATDPAVMLR